MSDLLQRATSGSRSVALATLFSAVSAGLLGAQVGYSQFAFPNLQAFSMAAGPDGNLWFLNVYGTVGHVTPSGVITNYSLPVGAQPGTITAGPDGALWFTWSSEGEPYGDVANIGRITTEGAITEYPFPSVIDEAGGITAGPDGALWFAQGGVNSIGRITTSGALTEYPAPTAGSFPGSIARGPDGALWFTEAFAANIGRITTGGTFTEYPIPSGAFSDGITAGPDGALWFTENVGHIGRITTTGLVTEFPIPETIGFSATAITAGPNSGYLWFVVPGGNVIGRINTAGTITVSPAPFAIGGTLLLSIAKGPNNTVWFSSRGASLFGLGGIDQIVSSTAALTVSPEKGVPSTEITITGSGFAPGETVNINLDNETSDTVETAAAGSTGSFTLSFALSKAPAGANSIFAAGQTSGKIGVANFTVKPQISAEPSSVGVGGTITIDGTGFDPYEEVNATVPDGQMATTTGGKGGFSASYKIPAGASPGVYKISAKGGESQEGVSVSVTVE